MRDSAKGIEYIHYMNISRIAPKFAFVLILGIVSDFVHAQQSLTGEQVLARFYKSLDDLDNLHYTINKTDTLVSGKASAQVGEAMLAKNRWNKNFPFLIYGKDHENEFLFNGDQALKIHHTKKEFVFLDPLYHDYRSLTGNPGGQLILLEFFFQETAFNSETGLGYNKISLKELEHAFVVTLNYPDNMMFGMLNRIKILTIDKNAWIPISVYHKFETVDGEKQVNICTLNNIQINDETVSFPIINTASLKGYREVFEDRKVSMDINNHEDLLNTPLIDMQLKSLQGSVDKLSDRKGKVVLLAFWETWCSPCIESVPKIKKLVNKYSSDLFEVWGIASDSATFSKVPSVVKRIGITYPVYYGTEQTKKDYQVTGVPEYVIIDQSGKIIFIAAGFSEEIEKKLDELLR